MALSGSVSGKALARERQKCPVPGDYVASMCVRDAVEQSNGKFPSFREPREIGNFSLVGEQRDYVDGAAQIKYLRMPNQRHRLMWDLNRGYEVAVRRDRSVNERLDNLLRWILRNKDKFLLSSAARPSGEPPAETQSLHTDFVCYRGLLTRLACTAYEAREDWLLAACRFRGSIYLCAFETDAERRRRLEDAADPRRDRMSFWGYKFEQYMVSVEPEGVPDVDAVVNECEEYCIVVRSRLESHSLVFGAEVDGVDPRVHRHGRQSQPGSTGCYIELKTSRDCLSEQQYRNFCRFKMLKWWAQSFLVGIPRVLCGFRDDNGVVGTLEELDVREMTHRAKGMWSGAVCMNFCNQLLSFIKKHATQDDPEVVYLFQYLPSSREIVCTHLADPGEFAVLPDWYLQAFDAM
ncbi:decapping and exoribonuclease protein isoform X1 [Rhipicephalus sanguineus]|uniref:decapping and exoribonuclease protein isoform X1 n=1 Tax=Rhipicephalus sanguineus TaxID=34632 RepID=UPI001895CACB|nr:decapping and exoribonuclease protein isoform X1 [Rhipicephalus sanguineus]